MKYTPHRRIVISYHKNLIHCHHCAVVATVKRKTLISSIRLYKKSPRLKFKTSFNSVLFFLIALSVLVASVTYCDMTDYFVYYREYGYTSTTGKIALANAFEPLYTLLMVLFTKMHAPFVVFYGSYISVCMIVFVIALKRYADKYSSYIMCLFIIFPFINYLQQIRSTMGICIVIWGLKYLYGETKNIKKYIICVIVSAMFHVSCITYLIFVLPSIISVKRLLKVSRYLYAVFFLFMLFGYNYVARGTKAIFQKLSDLGMSKMSTIVRVIQERPTTSLLSIVYILMVLITTLVCSFAYYYTREDDEQIKVFYGCSLMNNFLALAILFENQAYRISFLALPIMYISAVISAAKIKKRVYRFIVYLSLIIVAILFFNVTWGLLVPEMNYRFTHVMWKQHPSGW